jgi:hypothetical protein
MVTDRLDRELVEVPTRFAIVILGANAEISSGTLVIIVTVMVFLTYQIIVLINPVLQPMVAVRITID